MTRLIVLVACIVAFCAGMMVDRVVTCHAAPGGHLGPGGPGGPGGYLASQLNLTADQQTKMKDIWSSVRRPDHGKREDIRRSQEQAVADMIRPEDKRAYDKIVADGKSKLDAMEADGRRAFDDAVAKTKLILTPDQLKKYEQLVQRPWEHHDHDRPATRPGDR